jgi:SPP1 family predicted phage head-tail adaptor
MGAGKYDRRVTIIRAEAGTRDEYGEVIPGADGETETWASVKPLRGSERFVTAENAAQRPMTFRFRWRDDLVRVTDVILGDDGRRYDVTSVIEIGRREEIEAEGVARGEAV